MTVRIPVGRASDRATTPITVVYYSTTAQFLVLTLLYFIGGGLLEIFFLKSWCFRILSRALSGTSAENFF